MRKRPVKQPKLFYQFNVENLTPPDHPIREIKRRVDEALGKMQQLFDSMYSTTGAPSIPVEMLLKAQLLKTLYGIPSDVQLCDQLTCNMRYRWFVGLGPDDRVFTPEVFSMNRLRFEAAGVHEKLFYTILEQAYDDGLLNHHDFCIDGTLIQAWGSFKSFRPKDEPPEDYDSGAPADFRGERRSNATHQSVTDPLARLASKGGDAKLAHQASVAIECNHGLVVAADLRVPSGTAERDAVPDLLDDMEAFGLEPRNVCADKGYDAAETHHVLEQRGVTSHILTKTQPRKVRTPAQISRFKARLRNAKSGAKHVFMRVWRMGTERPYAWLKARAGLDRAMWPRMRPGSAARRTGPGYVAVAPPDVVCQHLLLAVTGFNLVRLANIARK